MSGEEIEESKLRSYFLISLSRGVARSRCEKNVTGSSRANTAANTSLTVDHDSLGINNWPKLTLSPCPATLARGKGGRRMIVKFAVSTSNRAAFVWR